MSSGIGVLREALRDVEWAVANPDDALQAAEDRLKGYWFEFGTGTYWSVFVYVWSTYSERELEDLMEVAAEWLGDNAPGVFEDLGDTVYEEDDLWHTQSGSLRTHDLAVAEVPWGTPLYRKALLRSLRKGDFDLDDRIHGRALAARMKETAG